MDQVDRALTVYTEDKLEHLGRLFRQFFHESRRCFYCGIKTRRVRSKPPQCQGKGYRHRMPPDAMTAEHVIPKAHGGGLTVTCCFKCNGARGSMSIEEFRSRRYEGKPVEFFFETELRRMGAI